MRYLPHTPEEVAEMLRVIGKRTLDELFETIPEGVRHTGLLKVPPSLDQQLRSVELTSSDDDLKQAARELREKLKG